MQRLKSPWKSLSAVQTVGEADEPRRRDKSCAVGGKALESRGSMYRCNNLLGTASLALQCDGVLHLVFWSRRNDYG
jgi:hypothetical protein